MARKPFTGQGFADHAEAFVHAHADPAEAAFVRAVEPGQSRTAQHGLPPGDNLPPLPTPIEADAIILRRNLRRRMKSVGSNPRKLSLEAKLNDGAVRQILEQKSQMPRRDTVTKLAKVLNCRPEDLYGDSLFKGAHNASELRRLFAQRLAQAEQWRLDARQATGTPRSQMQETANSIDFIDGPYEWDRALVAAAMGTAERPLVPRVEAARATFGDKDFPVYAAAQGGEQGVLIVDWSPVDFVRRPEPLIGVRDSFAMLIVEDSMAPALEHGDMALINPRLPPLPNKNAFFTRQTATGETYGMVKRLESWSSAQWNLRQFNPDRRFKASRSEWTQCMPIIGKYDRR